MWKLEQRRNTAAILVFAIGLGAIREDSRDNSRATEELEPGDAKLMIACEKVGRQRLSPKGGVLIHGRIDYQL
ncbi:MAG: hypothetical protein QOJ64_1285 [Acidobacteriota bacterium]|nr:hypothetical protein [Acidobacteriota bacterium]